MSAGPHRSPRQLVSLASVFFVALFLILDRAALIAQSQIYVLRLARQDTSLNIDAKNHGGLQTLLTHYRVLSHDPAGSFAASPDRTFKPPDVTPPTASITAPSPGAGVSGTIFVRATATDNVGVASVQFKLDGAFLGPNDTTPPYAPPCHTAIPSLAHHPLTAF